MDIEITKSDGSKYRLGDYGFYVNDVVISSIELERKYESKENLNGRISTGSTYQTRTISVPCFYLTKSLADIPYVRDLLYKLVVDTEPIKIRELRKKEELNYRFIQPTSDDYQEMLDNGQPNYRKDKFDDDIFVSGKEYEVMISNVITPKQSGKKISFEIEFETTKLPFGISIGTSLELEKNKKLDLWSTDFDIEWNENDPMRQYTFENTKGNSFFYHGSAPNDQFNMYKRVKITIGKQTTDFVWNLTHSETLKITGITLKPGDIIVYDGIRVYKNGDEISDKTNVAIPKFRYGYNHFEFNQIVQKVQFDMKFYYK